MKNAIFQYFVEGEDEKRLLNVLKSPFNYIQPGKIQILNVVQNKIPQNILRTLKKGTIVVLVFDTDTGNVDVLNNNIQLLNKCSYISKVITIPQVKNLEDELVRACNIRNITELLNSRSRKDFKSDLVRVTNLDKKLQEHQFDICSFWSQQPDTPYQRIINGANSIKRLIK